MKSTLLTVCINNVLQVYVADLKNAFSSMCPSVHRAACFDSQAIGLIHGSPGLENQRDENKTTSVKRFVPSATITFTTSLGEAARSELVDCSNNIRGCVD